MVTAALRPRLSSRATVMTRRSSARAHSHRSPSTASARTEAASVVRSGRKSPRSSRAPTAATRYAAPAAASAGSAPIPSRRPPSGGPPIATTASRAWLALEAVGSSAAGTTCLSAASEAPASRPARTPARRLSAPSARRPRSSCRTATMPATTVAAVAPLSIISRRRSCRSASTPPRSVVAMRPPTPSAATVPAAAALPLTRTTSRGTRKNWSEEPRACPVSLSSQAQ